MKKLELISGEPSFECPGCGYTHIVWVSEANPYNQARWTWNKSMDKPTFTPSLLVRTGDKNGPIVCHSFITDGKIKFLADCTHHLANRTVELTEVDDG